MHASTHKRTFLCELTNEVMAVSVFPCPWQPSWISIHIMPLTLDDYLKPITRQREYVSGRISNEVMAKL